MKWVRLENKAVREIIPDTATVPNIAHWYGEEFAAQCVQAPDEVGPGWTYDYTTGQFSPPPEPAPPPPDPIADLARLVVEQEYRLTLLELGVM